jgi:hypothetical protein
MKRIADPDEVRTPWFIEPIDPVKLRPNPVALLTPGPGVLRVETEQGTQTYAGTAVPGALAHLAEQKVAAYCDASLLRLVETTPTAAGWEGHAWHMALSSMRFGKLRIRPLRGALFGAADPFGELVRYLDWLGDYNISPASIPVMGWNLFALTLARPLGFVGPPTAADAALYGGRQWARPGRYRHAVQYDMAAAYPAAMTGEPIPTALHKIRVPFPVDEALGGLARATVVVPPGLDFSPLPFRPPEAQGMVVIYPRDLTIEGTWTCRDLSTAEAYGCEVTVHDGWIPMTWAQPFGEWWRLIREGRALGAEAGQLAKQTGNLLWGTFAMRGEPTVWHWPDGPKGAKLKSAAAHRDLPHRKGRFVAADITARVRASLHSGWSQLTAQGFEPFHVDTDGILVDGAAPVPSPDGDGPGLWRPKTTMRSLEVRAPQVWRYTCGEGCGVTHPRWHYKVAGRPVEMAEQWWRTEVGKRRFSVTVEIRGEEVGLSRWQVERVAERQRLGAQIIEARAEAMLLATSSWQDPAELPLAL